MIRQSALALTAFFPPLPLPPGADESAVEYRTSSAPKAFVRGRVSELDSLGTAGLWRLEPYRGVEFESLDVASSRANGRRRILVSRRLPEAVARELSRRGGDDRLVLAIGNRFEPYPTAEARFRITRDLLGILEHGQGLEIVLRTRSPLVLRDLDSLRRLDFKNAVTVRVPIPTVDKKLAARLEPHEPEPAARLEIVRSLARDGIAVVVTCGPVLPAINSSTDRLEPLFDAVRHAGALDLVADLRLARPRHRRFVGGWLERHFPDRAADVLGRLDRSPAEAHLGTFERLRLAYGFPALRSGRG